MEAVIGGQLAEGAGILDANRLQHLEEAARRLELGQADLVDRLDEARSAAVHDRHFGAVDLDQGVVDAKTAQRGQQMLDRGDRGAIAVAEHGAQRYARHRALVGRDLGAVGIAVGKEEAYPGVAVSGTKRRWRLALRYGPRCRLVKSRWQALFAVPL